MVYRHYYRRLRRHVAKRKGQLEDFWGHFRRVRNTKDSLEDKLLGILFQAMGVWKFTINDPQLPNGE